MATVRKDRPTDKDQWGVLTTATLYGANRTLVGVMQSSLYDTGYMIYYAGHVPVTFQVKVRSNSNPTPVAKQEHESTQVSASTNVSGPNFWQWILIAACNVMVLIIGGLVLMRKSKPN